MASMRWGLPCSACGVYFEDLDAFDKHLPCKRPTQWKEPKFKQPASEEPTTAEVTFIDARMGDPEGARWASETTRERVDARLRTRHIRALTWEPPVEEEKSIWKRLWEWLQK